MLGQGLQPDTRAVWMAWLEKGLWELDFCISVISISDGHQKTKFSSAVDHFLKYPEAVFCRAVSAEETCDHLIVVWISRLVCSITFQSNNDKAFVIDLKNAFMKKSQEAQAHSSTYHPQTNELITKSKNKWTYNKIEKQNRTLFFHAEGLLVTIYGRLWQAYTVSDEDVQQYIIFHHWDQAKHDIDSPRKNSFLIILLAWILYVTWSKSNRSWIICANETRRRHTLDRRGDSTKAYSEGNYFWVF